MPDLNDVRKIAMALPGAEEGLNFGGKQIAFSVPSAKRKGGFAWVWMERIDPKKPRVPNLSVIALRTSDLEEKESLLTMHPDVLFTEPHYNGYPAVLLRLDDVSKDLLAELVTDAWRSQATKELMAEYEATIGRGG